LGFVGRLTRDKGIPELLDAYDRLRPEFPDLRLLLVGDHEKGDPIDPLLRKRIETDPNILRTGFVEEIEAYYHVMSVLVLPTFREGFPNVILEAHAAGKPVVATRATGVVDAVIDAVTGILVPIGDAKELANALALVLKDKVLAARLGNTGRERVLREFRQELIWEALLEEYRALLQKKGQPLPEVSGEDSVPVLARAYGESSS
jgi:glycosyltransferase involved in cell wall biosynthesis